MNDYDPRVQAFLLVLMMACCGLLSFLCLGLAYISLWAGLAANGYAFVIELTLGIGLGVGALLAMRAAYRELYGEPEEPMKNE